MIETQNILYSTFNVIEDVCCKINSKTQINYQFFNY